MSETKSEVMVEFVPFGAEDKVKLSVAMVQNLIAVKTKSGKTCSSNDALKFIAKCVAKRLNPYEEDCFLIGYDGKDGPTFSFITAHQAFLKRAELHPEYAGMESGVIANRDEHIVDLEGDFYMEGDEILGGWATVFFKTRPHPMKKRVRLKRFQKSFGIWQEDPAGMIVKCAEADALRSSFPTMCGGMYLREEMEVNTNTTIATPIFKEPEPPKSAKELVSGLFQEPKPNPKPRVMKESKDTTKEIITRMAKANITETTMMGFLSAIGVVDKEKSMGELSDKTREMILSKWEDFAARIEEANREADASQGELV